MDIPSNQLCKVFHTSAVLLQLAILFASQFSFTIAKVRVVERLREESIMIANFIWRNNCHYKLQAASRGVEDFFSKSYKISYQQKGQEVQNFEILRHHCNALLNLLWSKAIEYHYFPLEHQEFSILQGRERWCHKM